MSFRYKTIIGIAIIEAVMLALLVFNALYILTSSNEKELIKRAQTTAELFATSNKDAVLSHDLATLESFVGDVLKHPGIIYARVKDRDGHVLAQKGDVRALERPFQPDTNYVDIEDGIFDACSLIIESGTTYGRVEIGFAINEIDATIASAQNQSIAFSGVAIIITAIFSLILGVYLTRSVNHLRSGAENISAGNLGYQITITGKDELSAAANAFNMMSRKLEQLEADRLLQNKELQESEKTYRQTFETTPIGMFHSTVDGQLIRANPSLAAMLGYDSPDELIRIVNKSSIAEQLYVDPEKRTNIINEVLNLHDWPVYENQYKCKDGKVITANLTIRSVRNSDDSINHIEGFVEDITERKRSELTIKSSLEEKSLLLKEIHHRVKNNMQVISSLINYQCNFITDNQYIEMFKESQNRIKTMSLVHEKLYLSTNYSSIDFDSYILSLANNLFTSYAVTPSKTALKIDVSKINLGIDIAIPCGLIINELLSNALKHGFPSDQTGEIRISFKRTQPSDGSKYNYELSVSDNGIGIPKNIDIRNFQSAGLQLVINLSEHQLHGQVELVRDNGTQFKISFEELDYKIRI